MADRRRLVTKSETTGTVTTLLDLETGSTYQSVRDSWVVTPGQRKPTMAASQHRYGGSRQTGEDHDNGSIEWAIAVAGTTADLALAAGETLLGNLESMTATVSDVYLEWRPEGASNSTFYEVRGPAEWKPIYKWSEFASAQFTTFNVKIPVAPLAELAAYDIAIGSTTLPATIALGSPITGNAPARASISLTTSGGTDPPIFAMFGWTQRPGTSLSGSAAPWGVVEAETGASLSGWAATSDAAYRGGSRLSVTTSGAGAASAMFAVDPSVMRPDEFTLGEVQIEVWARVAMDYRLVSPRMTLSLEPFAGTAFGAAQYSAEFQSVGRLLTLPTVGAFRFVKLGTLNMPVHAASPLKHNLKVTASWAVGSTGEFNLDYLVLVPARQRALSPSGKPNDGTYPRFISSTSATTKKIRSDLSGLVASGGGNFGRDCGLGGQLIEFPVGNVDLIAKLSSLTPDDPTADATSEQIAHTVTGTVRVTPRVWLAG